MSWELLPFLSWFDNINNVLWHVWDATPDQVIAGPWLPSIHPSIHPLTHSFIHPSISFCLPGVELGLQSSKLGYSRCSSPQQCFLAPPGGCSGIPRPDDVHNPSSEFWVYPGFPPSRVCSENLQKELPGGILINWLLWTKDQWLYSELPPDVQTPRIHKVEPSHPSGEDCFGCLYPQIQFLGHYPKLMTGLGRRLTGKSRAANHSAPFKARLSNFLN